jgi:hypothetical protein
MEKDPAIYVRHILEAIANIEADIAGYEDTIITIFIQPSSGRHARRT